jgi:hypothetical protein
VNTVVFPKNFLLQQAVNWQKCQKGELPAGWNSAACANHLQCSAALCACPHHFVMASLATLVPNGLAQKQQFLRSSD